MFTGFAADTGEHIGKAGFCLSVFSFSQKGVLSVDFIRGTVIRTALEKGNRTYLCGDLKRETGYLPVRTGPYEIGISEYREFTVEKAHLHRFNREYNYVIEGSVKVFLFQENREYRFDAGDLYVIEPDMPYRTKATAGTRVIFSKVPGGDDKQPLPALDDCTTRWAEVW